MSIDITSNCIMFTPDTPQPAYYLDCCQTAIPCGSLTSTPTEMECNTPKKKLKEKSMRDFDYGEDVIVNSTENERKASYFQNELNNASYPKRDDLREQFKLDLQESPLTPKEFVEWIKAGKFTFTKNELNDDGSWREPNAYHRTYNLAADYIRWNNPDRNVTGYQAAVAKLDLAEKTAERAITAASTPAEMLKVLQDFESTTLN